MTKIILATSSPYRQEAFKQLNIPFTSKSSNINEQFENRPTNPEELCLLLAKLKAEAVARNNSEGITIGFDTIAYFNNQILEKPKSREEAFNRLKDISEDQVEYFTGIHIINFENKKILSKVNKSILNIRKLSENEINKYLDEDPNFNTFAIGFDTLNQYSSTFIKNIIGSYNNVIRGIPTEEIIEILQEMGFRIKSPEQKRINNFFKNQERQKITLCGSIAFFKEMLEAKEELESLGHEVEMPPTHIRNEEGGMISVMEYYRLRKEASDDLTWIWDKKEEAMKLHFDKIQNSNSVLILNYTKKEIKNYIGANTLMEMGLAFHLKKPIFLLNGIPNINYKEEILAMKPVNI